MSASQMATTTSATLLGAEATIAGKLIWHLQS